MTVYGYIRVNTDKQKTENQRFKIERFLENIFNVFDFICFFYYKKTLKLYNHSLREAS